MAYRDYLTPVFTANQETDGVILGGTTEYSTTCQLWRAFNRTALNSSDLWLSSVAATAAAPQGIVVDFTHKASPVCLTSYSLQGRNYTTGAAPKTWYIEALLDQGKHGEARWVKLHEVSNASDLDNAAFSPVYNIEYKYDEPFWVRKIRLVILEGNFTGYVGTSNFHMSGYDNVLTDTPPYTPRNKWMWQVDAVKVAPDADILVGIAPVTRDMTVAFSPSEQGLFRFTNTLNYGDKLFFALDTKLKQLTCWHSRLDKVGTITYDFAGVDVVPVLGDIGSSGEVLATITGQQVFTQSGEFSIPEFVSMVDVLVVGGGGPGCQSTTSDHRGGGSGGEVVYQTGVTLPIGVATLPVTVGNSGQSSSFASLVGARAGNPGNGNQGGAGIAGDGVGAGGNYSANGVDGVDMSAVVGTELGDNGWFGGGGGGGAYYYKAAYQLNLRAPAGVGCEHGGGADGGTVTSNLVYVFSPGQANTGGGGGGGVLWEQGDNYAYAAYVGSLGGSGIVVVKWSISNAQYINKFQFNLGRLGRFSMDGFVREYDQLTSQGYLPYDMPIVAWFQPYVLAAMPSVINQIVIG